MVASAIAVRLNAVVDGESALPLVYFLAVRFPVACQSTDKGVG
jgi:hypothetical protein